MKLLSSKLAASLALTLAAVAANATPINGGFSISGGAIPLGGATMDVATGIQFGSGSINPVTNCTGDLATILGGASCGGATGTVSNIALGSIPLGNGGPIAYSNSTWLTLSAGGVVFSITGINKYAHDVDFSSISIKGDGVMSSTAAGWTPTIGHFSFTAQGADQTFSFSSSQVSSGSVPVPASMALLGLGLVGLGFSRRAKAA